MLADSPVVAYAIVQTTGKLELIGEIYDSAPYGYAVPKEKADFAKAIQGAVQKPDGQRHLPADPDPVGRGERGDHHPRSTRSSDPGRPMTREASDTRDRAGRRGAPEPIKAIPVRHPGRWVAVVVIACSVACSLNSLITNPNWEWEFQLRERVLPAGPQGRGGRRSWLTVASMLIGVVLGVVLAVMRLSPNPVLSGAAWVYIWVFRGTPVLVQLVFWGNLTSLYRKISLGIPFGPEWFTFADPRPDPARSPRRCSAWASTRPPTWPRSSAPGILSVDEGQTEAASALGMTRLQTLRRIVLPQAMRVIVPPTGNETISMLKTTSLVAYVPLRRAVLPDQRHRQPHLPADPDAGHGQHLVPGDDLGADGRPVLPRAALRRAASVRDRCRPRRSRSCAMRLTGADLR